MATVTLTSLGLGNADLTAIGKLSETGLSQVEIADAVVEGDKLKKGNITAGQVGAYTKAEVDGIIDAIPETDLSDYYKKTETETLLSNKVDKEVGKGLSTNDFTDTFKQALELNKVQNVTTDSVNKKLVVTYTDGTSVDLNLDDIVTDVKVEGAVLDTTTNVLTILSSDGGADVTIDLSVFVTNQALSNALVGKADKIHSHTTSDITGLDTTLSNKVDKNETIDGATKTKITYDAKGLVTGGADLVEADIPTLSQSKITNLTTDLTSKEISANKKTDMETNKLSDTFYPSIKAVYDWAKGLFVTNQTLSGALVGKADKVHTHSPAEVGLDKVDNTSDVDKPMSRAQSAAMLAKFNLRDVTQEVGDDASKVMSQKASTEAFYRAGGVQKAGKIYVQSTEPTENVEEGDIWLKI